MQDTAMTKAPGAAFAPHALTLLRVLVGLTMLLHGWPKLGNFGGFAGFVGSLGFPVPAFFAAIAIAIEVAGGLFLIVGLFTRWAGLLVAIEMLVTTVRVKLPNVGFIAAADRPGVGAELDLLLLAGALLLFTMGGGPWSVDRVILKQA